MLTVYSPTAGLAYAAFKCSDPRPMRQLIPRFQEALENILRATDETKIPPETRFSVWPLREGMAHIMCDGDIRGLEAMVAVVEAKGANLFIRSALAGAPNVIAARDLGDTLNYLYGGTELFDAENASGAGMIRDVFFKNEAGIYVSKVELEPTYRHEPA